MLATAPLVVQGWTFGTCPAGWEARPGAGLRRNEPGRFPSSVVLSADELAEGETLPAYVDRQLDSFRGVLGEPEVEGPRPLAHPGAEEARELVLSYTLADGPTPVVQRQLFVRRGRRLGVITETTTPAERDAVRPAFRSIVSGLVPPRD